MPPIIEVSHLQKQFKVRTNRSFISGLFSPEYKTVEAVKDISLTVKRGEAVAFLGPNGAGKTTTTKMLTGLIHPTQGTIQVLGHTPFDRKKDFLKRIGLVMGNKAGLNWDLTARQSFELLKNIYAIPEGDFKEYLGRLTELTEVTFLLDTQLRRLSLGERMKMELIGAILHRPEILFLDEPTIGLDIVTKKNIRTFLREIQQELQTTLILTSHDMDDVEHVCDRVVIINKGTKVYDDSLKTLTDQYRQVRYVRFFFQKLPPKSHFQGLGEITETTPDSYLFKVGAEQMISLITKAASQSGLLDMHIEAVPLEEIIAEIFHTS
jgi:ABC-2 type transport system ATP-binding protein